MNLTKLFDMQRKLDERIVQQKGLEGCDTLPNKILALLVELGELANEERSWKFWSEDREPRTVAYQGLNDGINEPTMNPLLEEYVDCLHFILSIGLDLGFQYCVRTPMMQQENVTDAFLDLYEMIIAMDMNRSSHDYDLIVSRFIELGELLGFTWEQIEAAYMEKNAINHTRQDDGY